MLPPGQLRTVTHSLEHVPARRVPLKWPRGGVKFSLHTEVIFLILLYPGCELIFVNCYWLIITIYIYNLNGTVTPKLYLCFLLNEQETHLDTIQAYSGSISRHFFFIFLFLAKEDPTPPPFHLPPTTPTYNCRPSTLIA